MDKKEMDDELKFKEWLEQFDKWGEEYYGKIALIIKKMIDELSENYSDIMLKFIFENALNIINKRINKNRNERLNMEYKKTFKNKKNQIEPKMISCSILGNMKIEQTKDYVRISPVQKDKKEGDDTKMKDVRHVVTDEATRILYELIEKGLDLGEIGAISDIIKTLSQNVDILLSDFDVTNA